MILCMQEAPALLVALASADVHLGDLEAAAENYHRATGDIAVCMRFLTYLGLNSNLGQKVSVFPLCHRPEILCTGAGPDGLGLRKAWRCLEAA